MTKYKYTICSYVKQTSLNSLSPELMLLERAEQKKKLAWSSSGRTFQHDATSQKLKTNQLVSTLTAIMQFQKIVEN